MADVFSNVPIQDASDIDVDDTNDGDLWGDDDWDDYTPDDETEDAPSTPQEQEPQEQTVEPRQQEEQEPAADQQQTPQLYTLKNRDETRNVTLEEMQSMAQMGWDYPNVREERDALRQEMEAARPALDLIDSYAQRSGMDRPAYLEYVRKEELKAQGMDDVNANATIEREKWEAQQQAQTRAMQAERQKREAAEAKERQRQEAVRADLSRFVQEYPNVKPDTIPQEVWADAKRCGSLTDAFTRAENRRLQAENAALRQNEANRGKSTGGMGGNSKANDADSLWGDDDDDTW